MCGGSKGCNNQAYGWKYYCVLATERLWFYSDFDLRDVKCLRVMTPSIHHFWHGWNNFLRLFIVVAFANAAGCTTSSEQRAVLERSRAERLQIGRDLEERLFSIRQVRPTFSVQQNLEVFERQELLSFVETIPGGSLIFGGFPAFWIDISRREERAHSLIRDGLR